jgi:hypothetical protein
MKLEGGRIGRRAMGEGGKAGQQGDRDGDGRRWADDQHTG